MYDISKTSDSLTFDEAYEKVIEELKKEGFGVLTEIDVKSTLKKKLDIDFDRYVILGACNPPYAHKVLEHDRKTGLLLPCNVCIWEKEGKVTITAIDPEILFNTLIKDKFTEPIAKEIKEKLTKVINAI